MVCMLGRRAALHSPSFPKQTAPARSCSFPPSLHRGVRSLLKLLALRCFCCETSQNGDEVIFFFWSLLDL